MTYELSQMLLLFIVVDHEYGNREGSTGPARPVPALLLSNTWQDRHQVRAFCVSIYLFEYTLRSDWNLNYIFENVGKKCEENLLLRKLQVLKHQARATTIVRIIK